MIIFLSFLLIFYAFMLIIYAMNISEYIDLCLVKRNKMSHAELARKTEQLPQVLHRKFKNDSFKISELEKIARALDAHLEIRFIDNETNQPIIWYFICLLFAFQLFGNAEQLKNGLKWGCFTSVV